MRTTPQLLDVVEVLAKAHDPIHGWEIARRAGREPHTVYRILERLRKAEWVEWQWGEEDDHGMRRRLYWFNDTGTTGAAELLQSRRHQDR